MINVPPEPELHETLRVCSKGQMSTLYGTKINFPLEGAV